MFHGSRADGTDPHGYGLAEPVRKSAAAWPHQDTRSPSVRRRRARHRTRVDARRRDGGEGRLSRNACTSAPATDVQKRITRSSAHRDPRYDGIGIACGPYPQAVFGRAARHGIRRPTTALDSAHCRSARFHRGGQRRYGVDAECRFLVGVRRAHRSDTEPRSAAGATISMRSSGTCSMAPTLPIVGDAPVSGRN